jgi:predicted nuclease of predicted toxin-antitoxin system
MRFLADENCDYAVVRALRSEGHDVVAVNEFQKRSVDRELMEMAQRDERILLTEDKDFGWLAFVAHLKESRCGVDSISSLRPGCLTRSYVPARQQIRSTLKGAFVVLRPGSVRISTGPLTD